MLENLDKRALVWALEVAAAYLEDKKSYNAHPDTLKKDAEIIRWVLGEEDVHYRVNVIIEEVEE